MEPNAQTQVTQADLPGLYQAANAAAGQAQRAYFGALFIYLATLILAAVVSFGWRGSALGASLSAVLFLISLSVLIWMRVKRPDGTWFNGRAVAESVNTRAWRWMMRADPYHQEDGAGKEGSRKKFLEDLKTILDQNRFLAQDLCSSGNFQEGISARMSAVRALPVADRAGVYLRDRIRDQADWYSKNSLFNKRRARLWFMVSVSIHAAAIVLLLFRIKDPSVNLPVEVVATLAGAALTWLKAKKHNELSSSYSLAAHEIVLIKGEFDQVVTEDQLSEFVINAESAFSREHTQWAARKSGH